MAEELRPYPIPNLIQGVSQQTAEQRRDTQAEAQFDCVNSPINGCEARPGIDLIKHHIGVHAQDAFTYEIFRGDSEHYLVVVLKEPWGAPSDTARRLHVYNMDTGEGCEVTFTATESYLATASNPRDKLIGATVNDNTFIANRDVLPAMNASDRSAPKYNEGIIQFKAGGYSIVYQVVVTWNGQVFVFTYETPDNSVAGNAKYITTNQIAATFFRGMTGGAAVPHSSGDVLAPGRLQNGNVGPVSAGQTTGFSGAVTLTSLGFYVGVSGNVVIIGRSDTQGFKIDVSDGVGGTYIIGVKDTAQSFNDLPKSCFEGFTTLVKGTNKATDDDYYVTWTGQDGQGGYWKEVPKPDIPIGLNPTTMPHVLVNTGLNTFEWKQAPWGKRLSGDGDTASPDPSFVGRNIYDMWYDNTRLAIMVEGSAVWSRTRNPFVYFPDSAQTTLDTDPVDIELGGGKTIALLRKSVQQDEYTFLWAPRIQFRISSGSNPFKQDTVEAKPSTRFEFAEQCPPTSIGDSLVFANEPGEWAAMKDLLIQDGKPRGATDITGHVLKYIPAGVRTITGSDTLGLLFVQTDGEPDALFLYNFLIDGEQRKRLQSAWNKWRLPKGSRIVWCSLSSNVLSMLIHRPDGMMIAKCDLSVDRKDDDTGAQYLTRLDYRVTEEQCTVGYDEETNTTTIGLPYSLEGAGTAFTDTTRRFFVANRADGVKQQRGYSWPVESVGFNSVVVRGNATEDPFYAGFGILAEREESRFYVRDTGGVVPTKTLTVVDYVLSYAATGYTRAEVTFKAGRIPVGITRMEGRTLGDNENLWGQLPITSGKMRVPIQKLHDEFSIKLINDTFLPSRWTTALYTFMASFYARPTTIGAKTPSGGTLG